MRLCHRLGFLFCLLSVGLLAHPTMRSWDYYTPGFHLNQDTETRADSLHGFDIQHYDVALAVNTDQHTLSGTVIATVLAQEALSQISYELVALNVTAVQVNGTTHAYTYSNNLITIPLSGVSAGQTFTTTVTFSGTPVLSSDVYHIGMIFNTNYVFTLSDPNATRYWIPVYDHPWDKATWSLHFTLRSDWTVAANGIRTSIVDNGDGTRTHNWEVSDPMVPHLVCLTASNYVELDDSWNGVPIQNFVPPSMEANAEADLAALPTMLQVFSDHYGMYPFEKYGNTVVPMVTYGAMEHQTMTTLNRSYITGDGSGAPTIAHEMAHSWFGNCVTPLTWKDVWLSESFATYSEAVYTEATEGFAAMCDYVDTQFERYYLNWENASSPATIYDPAFDSYFDPPSYQKGACVLHQLRLLVGDATFWNILRTYFQTYHNGFAVTSEFEAIAEQVSDRDLTQFFRQWIYESGIPSYDYALFYDHSTAAPRILPIVKSTCSTGTEFWTKLPFAVTTSAGVDSILASTSPNASDYAAFNLSSPTISSVTVDPHHWVIQRGITRHDVVLNFAAASDARVDIYWTPFWSPAAIDGYRVYRRLTSSDSFVALTDSLVTETHYCDRTATNGIVYEYAITAIKGGMETDFSNVLSATPIDFPMDQGVLLVDETRDGNGNPANPTDAQVDDFYASVIGVPFTAWDYATQSAPTLDVLRHYSTVVWHGDDFSENELGDNLNDLGTYLLAGGNVLISGWKSALAMTSDFSDAFLDGDTVQQTMTALFSSASGDYPTLTVDSSKLLSAWNGMLPYVCTFPGAQNGVYRFNGDGDPCAVRSTPHGTLIWLGFPLYYMQADGVSQLMTQVMTEYGETAVDSPVLPTAGISVNCYPNPTRSAITVAYSLPRSGQTSVAFYNVRGQLVRTFDDHLTSAGAHSLVWDGKNTQGTPVADGVYFVVVSSGDHRMTGKLIVLR